MKNNQNNTDKIPVLWFTCGIPGSGKSTWCENNKDKLNAVIHSSDSIREELLENVNDQSQNELVFTTLHKRVKEDLMNGKNVICDSTGLKRKNRLHFLRYIQDIPCKKICVLFATPLECCNNNNANRERKVPEYVIEHMVRTFECPAYAEKWDEIQIVWYDWHSDGLKFNFFDDLAQWRHISQDSPHHSLTIGDHMMKASDYYDYMARAKGWDELDVCLDFAILMHDCGKLMCKTYVKSDGNPSEYAHYYQHHSVGAYLSLFYLKDMYTCEYMAFTDNEILEMALLINCHMRPFMVYKNSDSAKEKDRKLFGDDFMTKLNILHMCDLAAH